MPPVLSSLTTSPPDKSVRTAFFTFLPSELTTAQNLRRSLFFSSDLPSGHILSAADIEIKSPGTGLHPKFLEIALNQRLKRDVLQDHPLEWEDIIL